MIQSSRLFMVTGANSMKTNDITLCLLLDVFSILLCVFNNYRVKHKRLVVILGR
jgi:hypothetical protein